MIRLQNNSKTIRVELCRNNNFPAELFGIVGEEPAESWNLYNSAKYIGKAQYWHQDRNGLLLMDFSCQADHHPGDVVNYVINRLISSYHPLRILTWTDDPEKRQVFSSALFYPKGRCMQRLVESYRYMVPDGCFDEEGYIIHQGNMKNIPFGHYSTSGKGCGWIAAYNLLKACGREKTMQEVSCALGENGWFGERYGQDMTGLRQYLLQQGMKIEPAALGGRNTQKAMKQSSCGILLYHTKTTSHYTMYRALGNGRFHFYNAVYGARHMDLSIEAFLEKYARNAWNTMLLWIK